MPLDEDSRECQRFLCPDGVYTPTRVLHGQCNAVAFIQSTLSDICDESLSKELLRWLDDVLAHSKDPDHLMQVLKKLFKLCQKYNLKLHSKKLRAFSNSGQLVWTGDQQ